MSAPPTAPGTHTGSRRTDFQIGLALSAMGFLLAGLGACVALLVRDLNESPDRLAVLPSAFAVGLLVIAAVGPLLLRLGDITNVLRGGSLVCAIGALLLALAPSFVVAIAGGLLVGLGGALLVLIAPLLLDGPTAANRLTRVNAVASATGVFGPLAIGGVDSLGTTGRIALLAPILPLLLLAALARPAESTRPADAAPASSPPTTPTVIPSAVPAVIPGGDRSAALGSAGLVARGWLRVVLAVAVEFCFVVWAVARLQAAGLPTATAALLGSAFPIGMAVGRAIGPLWIRGWSALVPSGALAAGGTLVVSLTGAPVLVVAGLALAGVGVAPLYPITIAALVATPGLSPARLAALGALASGTAILVAPAVLATLATVLDLRTAFLIPLPILLILFAISRPWGSGRTEERRTPDQLEVGSP
jgi:MFS family permease